MKQIVISYFRSQPFANTPDYQHNEVIPYTAIKREAIIDYFLNRNYNIMIIRTTIQDGIIIFVDEKKFQQR